MKKTEIHRILLAELSMSGVFHAGVNAGFVRLMKEVYPDGALHFIAEKSHVETCRIRLADISVHYRKLPVFPKVEKFTLPLRDLLGCIYAVRLFAGSRKSDTVFITNLLPLTHWCVWLMNGLIRRRLFIALHGQLEALLPDTSLRMTKPYFRLHAPLFRYDRDSRYVLLGEPVYQEVKPFFGPQTKRIVIDHPYDYGAEPFVPALEYPLRFGQVGVGNRGKGTEKLFRLGELLQDEIEAGRVELHLVGRLDPELRSRTNRWVKWHPKTLAENDFATGIDGLHYTLLLRNAGDGRAIASGSFFDTLKYGKPFLSLDSAFVRHYSVAFPGCGEVFSSVEAMAEAIRRICRDLDHAEYKNRTAALLAARKGLSIQCIAEQFKHQDK